jgi:hypothetical protein
MCAVIVEVDETTRLSIWNMFPFDKSGANIRKGTQIPVALGV